MRLEHEQREQERILVAGLVRTGIAGMKAGGHLTEEQDRRLERIIEVALENARDYERRCAEDKPRKRNGR